MSPFRVFVAAASIAALCVPAALAEPAPDGAGQHGWHMPSPAEMAAWHAQMCKDRYAREAGRLAYLQAALSITDAQRSAFDQWRDVKLAAAKTHSDACAARMPMAEHKKPDVLELNARAEKMLEARLDELRTERPALEAFYQSLTPDQKTLFDHVGRDFVHRHHMGERFGESRDGHDHDGHDHDGQGHDEHGAQMPG